MTSAVALQRGREPGSKAGRELKEKKWSNARSSVSSTDARVVRDQQEQRKLEYQRQLQQIQSQQQAYSVYPPPPNTSSV